MPAEGLAPARGRLGLIAGGGALPLAIAAHCRETGRALFVIRLEGFADRALEDYEGRSVPLGRFGEAIERLRAAGCAQICFAGTVSRPDFAALDWDGLGRAALPSLIAAAGQGDDALLRATAQVFADAGFEVEGAHDAVQALLLPTGRLGLHAPGGQDRTDIDKALEIARAMGRLDVGQGAVVAGGLVLAVEAQEGTDRMLMRVAELPENVRGGPGRRFGVIAKAPKPLQDRRLDLPVIGPHTLELAGAAGLAGLVGEAGGVIVLDRPAVIATANRLGLFVLGVEP